jgi:hypothetical protein
MAFVFLCFRGAQEREVRVQAREEGAEIDDECRARIGALDFRGWRNHC